MATPAYTTDLFTLDPADSTTDWSEPGAPETGGGTPQNGTEFFIEGSACVSKACAGVGGITGGVLYNEGAGVTITSGDAVYVWMFFAAPNTLLDRTAGGFAVCIGNSTTAYRKWYVLGKDNYAYGGWQCIAVDPTVAGSLDIGSPSGTWQYFGAVVKTSATISKGEPFGIDAIRHGRTLQTVSGESGNYGLFSGAATANDHPTTGRWGIFQAIPGGYQLQGRFLLGTSGTAVDFRDSNTSILIANTLYVSAGFNVIEIRNATSRVDWTSVSFLALGTVSRGNLVVTDNADVNVESCSFTDMGTFDFLSGSTINSSTFRRCNLITQGGATFSGCTIDSTNDSAKAMIASNPATISGCTFISSGTKHAIEITTPGTYAFVSNSFSGYATDNGSTGNEVIYNNSGGEVILNVSGTGTGTISYMNGSGATTTVSSSASLIINIVDETGTAITVNSEVTVVKNSDTSILFEEDGIVDGSTTYSYSSGGGTVVYINVFNVAGYQPKTVNNYTLPSSGTTTLTIQLDTERFYSNP